jgi:cardiolipin synthase
VVPAEHTIGGSGVHRRRGQAETVTRGRGDGGYDNGRYDADRYQDRADYRDFDAQPGYEDGDFADDYAEPAFSAPRGRRGKAAAEPEYEEQEYGEYEDDYRGRRPVYDDDDAYGDDYADEYDDDYADDEEPVLSSRIFTIPNLISLARLAGVPLFLGLILSPYYGGPKYDVWALVVLALSGFSDWLDGKLARRWNQMSKLGAMLDPLADRLYIIATLVGLTMRDIIPLWLPVVLIGRDVALLTLVPRLRKAGYGSALPVHFLGKAATFNLLYAFPLLLLGQVSADHKALTDLANIFGWAFVGWGTALYLLAGGMYFIQANQVTKAAAQR